jgi:DNA-binding Lrp family transcriptional regulator
MSTGAYVLVKFDDRSKLLPAVETIGGIKQIQSWDAVDGHFNLVLKLDSNDPKTIEQIRGLDGCSRVSSCEFKSGDVTEVTLLPELSYSYVFIETERFQQQAVQSSLEKNEAVAACIPVTGDCDLVALVKGETFDQIDRTVNNGIRPLDGIVRLKQDRIIFLDRL